MSDMTLHAGHVLMAVGIMLQAGIFWWHSKQDHRDMVEIANRLLALEHQMRNLNEHSRVNRTDL